MVTITVFVSTGRVLIQGEKYKDWSTAEFPVLLEIVNIQSTSPPAEEKSLFTSLSNFFRKSIIFVSDDEIPALGNTGAETAHNIPASENSQSSDLDGLTNSIAVEPLTVTLSRLNAISVLRDTVGTLEAEFTQFQITCICSISRH